MFLYHSRTYSMLYGFKRLQYRSFVRKSFPKANESRQEKKDKILSELRKSYISDLKEVKATGGKRFLAMRDPFPREKSIDLPAIQGEKLAGGTVTLPQNLFGKVSLILLWAREHGQKACDVYRKTFADEFKTNSKTNYYEVNLIHSWLFRLVRSFINDNLRKQIPIDRQENFICCYDGTAEIVNSLFENTLVGHAVLVDHVGLVRWKAHAVPTDEELSYLVNCTNILCNEMP